MIEPRILLGLIAIGMASPDAVEGRKHGEVGEEEGERCKGQIERWATNRRGRERESFFFRHFPLPNVEWPFIEIAQRPLFEDRPYSTSSQQDAQMHEGGENAKKHR